MTPQRAEARPGIIEQALRRVVGEDVAESAWGDLEEEARTVANQYGRAVARLWVSVHGLRLVAGIAAVSWRSAGRLLGEGTMDGWSDRHRRLAAIGGTLAAMPAAMLVVSGVLYSASGGGTTARVLDATLFDPAGLGYRVVLHPAVVLGGLLAAVGLNLIPLLRLSFEAQAGTVHATIGLRLRPRHLLIAAAGLGLLLVILAYAFTENFEVVQRAGMHAWRVLPALIALA